MREEDFAILSIRQQPMREGAVSLIGIQSQRNLAKDSRRAKQDTSELDPPGTSLQLHESRLVPGMIEMLGKSDQRILQKVSILKN
jgi:hypothetical protein